MDPLHKHVDGVPDALSQRTSAPTTASSFDQHSRL